MEGEIWDTGDTLNTSDSQSLCSTDKSKDSLVRFSDIHAFFCKQEFFFNTASVLLNFLIN